MSKKDTKFYICIHSPCTFKTDKRKAIYTHLVRTHNERKEDYECEYCSTIFHLESGIEDHLQEQHPTQPFTYTCVSRIENVINKCAKIGAESKRPSTPVKTNENTDSKRRLSTEIKGNPLDMKSEIEDKSKLNLNLRQRTKASVNESLNNIAKQPKFTEPCTMEIKQEHFDEIEAENYKRTETEEDSNTFISKPSGLKIKLNLKKIAECSSRETSRERSNSPPYLEPNIAQPEVDLDSSDIIASSPPNIIPTKSSSIGGVIREKASKYYDRLEVYHKTDEFGRRCCPFCPYKTSKNTIRVHLSGIHKIHFVKCSLCDYKAAFPHQISQHGVKFHKTTNINVIQLSKDSRDRTIAKLPKPDGWEPVAVPAQKHKAEQPQTYNYSFDSMIENEDSNDSVNIDDCISEESFQSSEEFETGEQRPTGPADSRVFKPPKCQTSKTDYYSIHHENGVYMYSCNLCTFQTPVRATIYTHKYRHEEKAYRCGYCDFMSAPRSNVVHHCRSRHKYQPISVAVIGDHDGENGDETETKHSNNSVEPVSKLGKKIKTEPMDTTEDAESMHVQTNENQNSEDVSQDEHKNHQTIIKVPQFKRTLTPYNPVQKAEGAKRQRTSTAAPLDYKLSMNKLYKINPNGSPKYLCAECPYACDTHPKMKHHLYRHRPQSYKCPYCDHRKYPRSYVVRHVRDTHRDKAVRVIDLAKGNLLIDIPEYQEHNEACDALGDSLQGDMEGAESFDGSEAGDDAFDGDILANGNGNLDESMQKYIRQEMDQLDDSTGIISQDGIKREHTSNPSVQSPDDSSTGNDVKPHIEEQHLNTPSPVVSKRSSLGANSALREALKLNTSYSPNFNDEMFKQTPDVSPNFSEAVYTSTPLIESFINGQYNNNNLQVQNTNSKIATKNFEKKKSLKDYRVNFGPGPRYICNICGYGTENYKTIHNHMYRHESQRYQCPYCGYRRSPKSFVENHIREVHKGHPVIVTELNLDIERAAPLGSPRQRLNLKRKDPVNEQTSPSQPLTPPMKKSVTDEIAVSQNLKTPTKWPAPKPASQVNLTIPSVPVTPQLQIPVKQRMSNSETTPVLPPINVPLRSLATAVSANASENGSTNVPVVVSNAVQLKPESSSIPPVVKSPPLTLPQSNTAVKTQSANNSTLKPENPFKFKEGSRTTYKTMYKCVFDPETCNHISKDKSKMKQHLFMHVEYKPWCCDFCDMTASQSSHIKNHVRTEHIGSPDMSFKYKRHNYLEKHIDGFLTKGLFTVPVNEYRVIMDMKGNTKTANRSTFTRDNEGFILCPHCDYKTKSGGMTDHVKMKHMQPRFKCHWCDYKAFYRSEIRKHHRKERSHVDLDFKTQELDLVQVMEGYKAANNVLGVGDQDTEHDELTHNANESVEISLTDSIDDDDLEEDDDDDEFGDDVSSNDGSSIGDYSNLGYIEYTTEQLSDLCSGKGSQFNNMLEKVNIKEEHDTEFPETIADQHSLQEGINTEISDDGCMTIVHAPKFKAVVETGKIDSKFKCGYCSFSAELRVKVKMHCSKKHSERELLVVDPVRNQESDVSFIQKTTENSDSNNFVRVNANDWKGTKFEQDLKKAGVSKLNLASLFPHSKRFSSTGCGEDLENSGNIDEDDIEDEEESDVDITESHNDDSATPGAQLIIPFKKATEVSRIDIPLTKPSKTLVDTDKAFKKPLDPVPSPRFSERKREKISKSDIQTKNIPEKSSEIKFEKTQNKIQSVSAKTNEHTDCKTEFINENPDIIDENETVETVNKDINEEDEMQSECCDDVMPDRMIEESYSDKIVDSNNTQSEVVDIKNNVKESSLVISNVRTLSETCVEKTSDTLETDNSNRNDTEIETDAEIMLFQTTEENNVTEMECGINIDTNPDTNIKNNINNKEDVFKTFPGLKPVVLGDFNETESGDNYNTGEETQNENEETKNINEENATGHEHNGIVDKDNMEDNGKSSESVVLNDSEKYIKTNISENCTSDNYTTAVAANEKLILGNVNNVDEVVNDIDQLDNKICQIKMSSNSVSVKCETMTNDDTLVCPAEDKRLVEKEFGNDVNDDKLNGTNQEYYIKADGTMQDSVPSHSPEHTSQTLNDATKHSSLFEVPKLTVNGCAMDEIYQEG